MKYNIELYGNVLKIGFGDPAPNTEIVREVAEGFRDLQLPGGELLLINGPASLPVAFALAHHVCHLYSAVGVFDPKLSGYVVAISHDPKFSVGDLLPQ